MYNLQCKFVSENSLSKFVKDKLFDHHKSRIKILLLSMYSLTKECFYKHGGICLVIVVSDVEPAALFSKLRHGGAFGEAQTMSHKRQKWPLSGGRLKSSNKNQLAALKLESWSWPSDLSAESNIIKRVEANYQIKWATFPPSLTLKDATDWFKA